MSDDLIADLQPSILIWLKMRQERDKLEADINELAESIMKTMSDLKSVTVIDGADKITVTKVEGTRIVIDEPKLKKSLGAAVWNRITKAVLDKEKLENEVAVGHIDPNVVAAASEEKPVKPYLKPTVKEGVVRVRRQTEAAKKIRRKK